MQTTQSLLLRKVFLGRIRFHPASTIHAEYRLSATIRYYTESKGHNEEEVVTKSTQQIDSNQYNNSTSNAQDHSPKKAASPISIATDSKGKKKKYYSLKNYREGPNSESGEVDSSQNKGDITEHNKDVASRKSMPMERLK